MNGLTCDEARELVPLLALDALDVDERDVLHDHLAGCPACLEELAELSEAAASIALALPQHDPSPGLKARVLNEARRARVLPHGAAVRPDRAPIWRREPASRLRVSLTSLVAGIALLLAAGSTLWAL